jgi:hypothetical protein
VSDTLSEERISLVKRCIDFLQSGHEYRWPAFNFFTGNARWFDRLFGNEERKQHIELEKFKAAGAIEVWPFFEKEEYETWACSPRGS